MKTPDIYYFFYGTLMDTDVLELVLARPVGADELTPARLSGFSRVYALNEHYPILVDDAKASVEGCIIRVAEADVERINYYESEGEDYDVDIRTVLRSDGTEQQVRVFLTDDEEVGTDRPWDLATWQVAEKAAFMESVRSWMTGEAEWQSAEPKDEA